MKYLFIYLALASIFPLHAMDKTRFVKSIVTMQREHANVTNILMHFYHRHGYPGDVAPVLKSASQNLARSRISCWSSIAEAISSPDAKTRTVCKLLCKEHASVLQKIPVEISTDSDNMRIVLIGGCNVPYHYTTLVVGDATLFNSAFTCMLAHGLDDEYKNAPAVALVLQLGAQIVQKSYNIRFLSFDQQKTQGYGVGAGQTVVCETSSVMKQACEDVSRNRYAYLLRPYAVHQSTLDIVSKK